MDHFRTIYQSRADAYHRMIEAEDADRNLPAAVTRLCSPIGTRRVDIGTGTGRLPILLGHYPGQTIAFDLHFRMLQVNQQARDRISGTWDLVQADMRSIPVVDGWSDLATAGWAIGHFCGWYPQDWKNEIASVLKEMQRITCPPVRTFPAKRGHRDGAGRCGGRLVVLETMSTGSLVPEPPNAVLAAYYEWLEKDWGFERTVISTDYQFETADEAAACTEFFFGDELAQKIRRYAWSRVPEWTGIWVKTLA